MKRILISKKDLANLYADKIGYGRHEYSVAENFHYITNKYGVPWHDDELVLEAYWIKELSDPVYDHERSRAYRAMISIISELWEDADIPVNATGVFDQSVQSKEIPF